MEPSSDSAQKPAAFKVTYIGDFGDWEGPKIYKSMKAYEAQRRHDEDQLSLHIRARIARAKQLLSDEFSIERIAADKDTSMSVVRRQLELLCDPNYQDTEEEESRYFAAQRRIPTVEDFAFDESEIVTKEIYPI